MKCLKKKRKGAARDVEQQGDSLETLLLNGHAAQILLQSLAKLSQLLLGNHHFLTDQQQRLERKRSRGSLLAHTIFQAF